MSCKGKKPTKAEQERRVEEAMEWLCQNPMLGYQKFMDYFMPRWNLSRNQALVYKKRAEQRLGQESQIDVNLARRKSKENYQRLFDLAMKEGNLDLAYKISAQMDKVTGALAPVKTEVTQKEDRQIFQVIKNDKKSS